MADTDSIVKNAICSILRRAPEKQLTYGRLRELSQIGRGLTGILNGMKAAEKVTFEWKYRADGVSVDNATVIQLV